MDRQIPHLVDVIIPAFNCEKNIKNTVSSIQNCNLKDYAIIIVDDGSTDNTPKVCEELIQSFSNIRYISQKNAGASAARNRGICESTGHYLLFVDADDTLLPFRNDILNKLQDGDFDILIFGMLFQYYHKSTLVRQESLCIPHNMSFPVAETANHWDSLFYTNYLTPVWNKFFRRSVLLENNILFDCRLTNYEDLAFSLHAISKSKTISVFSEPYYLYSVDYDHDHTTDRIAKINDIMANTDLICHRFLELESAIAPSGIPITPLRQTILNIYFDIFRVKLKTETLIHIGTLCDSFLRNQFIRDNLSYLSDLSVGNQRLYRQIARRDVLFIWATSRYYIFRHFIARNIKRFIRRTK